MLRGNNSLPSTNGCHRSLQPRIHLRHPDVMFCMSSDLLRSFPLLQPHRLQPLLHVQAEIDSRGVLKPSCDDVCTLLAIGGYLSHCFDDVEGQQPLKPVWFGDTDHLCLSRSNAHDAGDVSIREHELSLLE